jgi:hypothetical protein
MNRSLAIAFVAAVAGCLPYSATDVISEGGCNPSTFYVPGTDTPLDTGARVITFPPEWGNPDDQDLVAAWLQQSLGVDEKTAKEIEEASTVWWAADTEQRPILAGASR